jgi:hypothetical protein
MKIKALFQNLSYVGTAEGDRNSYEVFANNDFYLVASRSGTGAIYVNAVDRDLKEAVAEKFSGKSVTSKQVKESFRRFAKSLDALTCLYVLVALGEAKKLSKREGKALVFKVK